MKKFEKTCNGVSSLFYHIITVVKYRQKVFTTIDIINDMKTIISEISNKYDVNIIEQGFGDDHVHLLIKCKPTLDITRYINTLKGQSSRDIRKKYKDFLKDKLWGDHFWSSSYFIATSGNVSIDVLKQYVEDQRTLQE